MKTRLTAIGIIAALGLLACSAPAGAGLIWMENFDGRPDLSSGNWHWNITGGGVDTAGTWDTTTGAAVSNNSGAGIVQSSAQYVFTSAEKSAFGSLYDAASGYVGGGAVGSTLYVRVDAGLSTATGYSQFAYFQTQRGSTTNCADLGSGAALGVGNGWGSNSYRALANNTNWCEMHSPAAGLNQSLHAFVTRYTFGANGTDSARMWLDPTLGVDEASQPSALTSDLSGNFAFDTFVLRVGNNNSNWRYDNIRFGTTFADVMSLPEPATVALVGTGLLLALGFARRRLMK